MSSSEYTNNNASMGAFSKAKDLQKKIEPKFPFFSYFFDKKEDLKIFCKEN